MTGFSDHKTILQLINVSYKPLSLKHNKALKIVSWAQLRLKFGTLKWKITFWKNSLTRYPIFVLENVYQNCLFLLFPMAALFWTSWIRSQKSFNFEIHGLEIELQIQIQKFWSRHFQNWFFKMSPSSMWTFLAFLLWSQGQQGFARTLKAGLLLVIRI